MAEEKPLPRAEIEAALRTLEASPTRLVIGTVDLAQALRELLAAREDTERLGWWVGHNRQYELSYHASSKEWNLHEFNDDGQAVTVSQGDSWRAAIDAARRKG